MGLFDVFKKPDINSGVEKYRKTKGAVLLDVRTDEEFRQGHISEAVNIPLQEIDRVSETITDKSMPLFVYCRSGARSSRAAAELKHMGYKNVSNIGGMLVLMASMTLQNG